MKIGWHKDDLDDVLDVIHCVSDDYLKVLIEDGELKAIAESYAEENHEIEGESDMEFAIYIEHNGVISEINMFTECSPIYSVHSANEIKEV